MRTPERIWNDEGKEARAGAEVGEEEGKEATTRAFCAKNAQTAVFVETTLRLLVASSTTTILLPSPEFIAPFVLPSLRAAGSEAG